MALNEQDHDRLTTKNATRYRIARQEPLAHPMRRGILDALRTRPGRTSRDLMETLGIDAKTLEHHASVLAAIGCIDVRAEGGRRWFFPREGAAAPKRVVATGETAARLLAHALERPGTTMSEFGDALGLSLTAARWQVTRLMERGFLTEAGAGYAVAPSQRDAVREGLGLRGGGAR